MSKVVPFALKPNRNSRFEIPSDSFSDLVIRAGRIGIVFNLERTDSRPHVAFREDIVGTTARFQVHQPTADRKLAFDYEKNPNHFYTIMKTGSRLILGREVGLQFMKLGIDGENLTLPEDVPINILATHDAELAPQHLQVHVEEVPHVHVWNLAQKAIVSVVQRQS
jgi:hypothetical protein